MQFNTALQADQAKIDAALEQKIEQKIDAELQQKIDCALKAWASQFEQNEDDNEDDNEAWASQFEQNEEEGPANPNAHNGRNNPRHGYGRGPLKGTHPNSRDDDDDYEWF